MRVVLDKVMNKCYNCDAQGTVKDIVLPTYQLEKLYTGIVYPFTAKDVPCTKCDHCESILFSSSGDNAIEKSFEDVKLTIHVIDMFERYARRTQSTPEDLAIEIYHLACVGGGTVTANFISIPNAKELLLSCLIAKQSYVLKSKSPQPNL